MLLYFLVHWSKHTAFYKNKYIYNKNSCVDSIILFTERYVFGLWGGWDKASFSTVPNRPIWVWVIGVMTTKRVKLKSRTETCSSVTSTNTNATWINQGFSPGLCNLKPVHTDLSSDTARSIHFFTSEALVDKHETKLSEKLLTIHMTLQLVLLSQDTRLYRSIHYTTVQIPYEEHNWK